RFHLGPVQWSNRDLALCVAHSQRDGAVPSLAGDLKNCAPILEPRALRLVAMQARGRDFRLPCGIGLQSARNLERLAMRHDQFARQIFERRKRVALALPPWREPSRE